MRSLEEQEAELREQNPGKLLVILDDEMIGRQSLATIIHAARDAQEQSAAQRLLAEANAPGAVEQTLSVLSRDGTAMKENEHLQPRPHPRRVSSVKELREAAEMARNGVPVPGSLAYAKLQKARDDGDLTMQRELTAAIVKLAPAIDAAADEKEAEEQQAADEKVRSAQLNLSRIQAAKDKQARKAARRARNANMQHGAREEH